MRRITPPLSHLRPILYSRAVHSTAGPAADRLAEARCRARALIRNTVAFVTAGALACFALAAPLPFPTVSGIGQKYRVFAAQKDRCDVLFVGSSRFFHQIIPAQLDAAISAATGQPVRSFNCGYDGMYPPESFYFLRQLLALHPARLRWVVVELMELNPRPDAGPRTSQRTAYWHDWQHTRLAWRHVWSAPELHSERGPLACEHGWHLLKMWVNLGRGAELAQQALAVRATRPESPPAWAGARGYEPGPDTALTGSKLARYLSDVESLRAGLPPRALSPALSDGIRALSADIRAAGAEPLFVLAPTVVQRENFRAMPPGAPLFAFNDPARYPTLFDPANRYDGWHLNARGAVEFTRVLAERLIEHEREASASAPRLRVTR